MAAPRCAAECTNKPAATDLTVCPSVYCLNVLGFTLQSLLRAEMQAKSGVFILIVLVLQEHTYIQNNKGMRF